MHYINSWCRIRNGAVWANGQPVLEEIAPDITAFLTGVYRKLDMGYPKFYKMDRLSQLGILAAEVLLKERRDANEYPTGEIGVVLANAHSSLDTDIRYQETMSAIPSPAVFVYTLPNIAIGEICIRHQFRGENTFFIFEQYDIPFLNDYINQLLDQGAVRAVIGGWLDVWQEHYDAFLYLVEEKQKPGSLIHNQQTIRELYGSVDAGS